MKDDLIFFLKTVNDVAHIDSQHVFSFNAMNTRGHSFKVNHQDSRVDCRKYFFINRTVPMWNVLPSEEVNVDCVDMFLNMDLSR